MVLSADRVDRDNLSYRVEEVTTAQKESRIHDLLVDSLRAPGDGTWSEGAAIVYARTRRRTEELAEGLRNRGWNARHFHGGMDPPEKKISSGSVRVSGYTLSSWPRTHSVWA